MSNQVSLAPIQGITDYQFRNTFNQFFTGVSFMYSPYLRLDKEMRFKNAKIKDILPENNKRINLIPQIMANNSKELIYMSEFLYDKGYEHINWNLGCPFPMVTNRELGSGLLPHYNKIGNILDKVIDKINVKLSIKMRLGYENEEEIFKILPIFEKFPLQEVIIHPRTGKQMYKGEVNLDAFEKYITLTNHKITYNGDIKNLEDYQNLKSRFKTVNSWMVGRGLIANPFLASQVNQNLLGAKDKKMEVFRNFHNHLCELYLNNLSGQSQLLNKMRSLWEYFSISFSNSHQVYKRIKKATSIEKYKMAVEQNFTEEKWIA